MERHADTNFQLIGINTGDDAETYRAGVEEHGLTWPVFYQGMQGTPIADLYQVRAYPTIYVLDKHGKIRSTNARGAGLDRLVEELLTEE